MTTNLRDLANGSRHGLPSGVDLMRHISEGTAQKAPSEMLLAIRAKVVEACDELIEVGARIRPLVVDGKTIGWVRGVHNTERRRLLRWVHDPNEFILSILTLATSLKKEEIEEFTALEIRNLIELVQKMTEFDISLYPYLSAFTGTMVSENLWHGRGTLLTSFENREIELPDGAKMKVLTPSEHARLWATLCVYREQAKTRMDANWNAVLQVRPLAGKSVEPLANELKALAKQLATDSVEPWESIIAYKADTNLDDGWAHPENMESTEGMLKEIHGMMNFDKHEQVMAEWESTQLSAAKAQKDAIAAAAPNRELGVNEETMWVSTGAELQQLERDLKRGRVVPRPVDREKTEMVKDPVNRMNRYK